MARKSQDESKIRSEQLKFKNNAREFIEKLISQTNKKLRKIELNKRGKYEN